MSVRNKENTKEKEEEEKMAWTLKNNNKELVWEKKRTKERGREEKESKWKEIKKTIDYREELNEARTGKTNDDDMEQKKDEEEKDEE